MSQNSKLGEFEQYLEGKSTLSQLYADLPEVELPDHLDAAILAEAHRAVGSRPGAKRRHRWAIPLSMVATLFVAVMIGLQLPYMLNDAAQPQHYNEEKIAALMDNSMAERSNAVPEEGNKIQQMAKQKSEITRSEPAPRAVQAAVPEKPSSPMLAPPAVPAPSPAMAAKGLELREHADIDNGGTLAKEKKSSGHAQGYASDALEQRAPAAVRMAAPQSVQLESTLIHPLKDESSDASLTAKDWLASIKRLKQQGRLEEAGKELAAFKKRYPDYPVPEALQLR